MPALERLARDLAAAFDRAALALGEEHSLVAELRRLMLRAADLAIGMRAEGARREARA